MLGWIACVHVRPLCPAMWGGERWKREQTSVVFAVLRFRVVRVYPIACRSCPVLRSCVCLRSPVIGIWCSLSPVIITSPHVMCSVALSCESMLYVCELVPLIRSFRPIVSSVRVCLSCHRDTYRDICTCSMPISRWCMRWPVSRVCRSIGG